jgi:hypothetical protein
MAPYVERLVEIADHMRQDPQRRFPVQHRRPLVGRHSPQDIDGLLGHLHDIVFPRPRRPKLVLRLLYWDIRVMECLVL